MDTHALTMEHLYDTVFVMDYLSIQSADEVSAVSNQIKNIIDLKNFLNNQ